MDRDRRTALRHGLHQMIAGHLAALQDKDLDAYGATLADDVVLVLPGGGIVDGRPAVVALHRELFADNGWSQERFLRRVVLVGGTGWALVEYRSTIRDDDGQVSSERRAYFTLTCSVIDDIWLVIADQNTSILPVPEIALA
ncbi:DUF4440 domain-containing protein [Micromonospora sp. NPDC005324]|uniref:YybH family protein n=1 Tax=Micromonospora sp. NPDC005324 TaxID=3157033 RepID=UPI0033A3E4C9